MYRREMILKINQIHVSGCFYTYCDGPLFIWHSATVTLSDILIICSCSNFTLGLKDFICLFAVWYSIHCNETRSATGQGCYRLLLASALFQKCPVDQLDYQRHTSIFRSQNSLGKLVLKVATKQLQPSRNLNLKWHRQSL